MPHPPLGPPRWARSVTVLLASVLLGALVGCQPGGTGGPVSSPTAPVPTTVRPTTPSPSAPATPTPTATTPTGSASATPTAPRPSAPISPSTRPGPDRSLERNAVYQVDLGRRTVSCRLRVRSPKPPLRNADLAPYLRKVVKCLVETFATPLADGGFDLTTPKVKTYAKTVKTPCGTFGQKGAPAYYCSTTSTIYWPQTGDDGNEAYTFARLGYVGLVAHEFGHHLQASTGMLAEYGSDYYTASKKQKYVLSRRLELQAQCFEGVYLASNAKSIDLSANDRSQLRVWHGYTGDEDPPSSRKPDHGTSGAQIRWLDRGLNSGDVGRCNTWSAAKKTVR